MVSIIHIWVLRNMRWYKIIDKGILRWFLVDFLSSPIPGRMIAVAAYCYGHVLSLLKKKGRAAEMLMMSHRLFPNDLFSATVIKKMDYWGGVYPELMEDDVKLSVASSRSIVVKMPRVKDGGVSKGIIFITFTDTFRYYYNHIDIRDLLEYFHVVLEPSWAGYCLPEILFWTMFDQPVIVQATEVLDRDFITNLNSNLEQIDTGASDWVNYNKYYHEELEIIYDSIYVANYNPVKRLHIYFKALREIKKRGISYKGAIVCARWGGQKEVVLNLVRYYDVADILDIHESLKAVEINSMLNRSKCNLLLSRKEGSNRSLFEAMFTDTPVVMLKNNIGVNKDYINASTGMLVSESNFASALLKMKGCYRDFSPRKWAMKNISPEVTTDKITRFLHSLDSDFVLGGNDVKVKTNDPEVNYFDKSAGLNKVYYMEKILTLFDNKLGEVARKQNLFALSNEFYGESDNK